MITVGQLFDRCTQPDNTVVKFYIDSFYSSNPFFQCKISVIWLNSADKNLLDSEVLEWDYENKSFRVLVKNDRKIKKLTLAKDDDTI